MVWGVGAHGLMMSVAPHGPAQGAGHHQIAGKGTLVETGLT